MVGLKIHEILMGYSEKLEPRLDAVSHIACLGLTLGKEYVLYIT
jgi:hypothetical protein